MESVVIDDNLQAQNRSAKIGIIYGKQVGFNQNTALKKQATRYVICTELPFVTQPQSSILKQDFSSI